MANTYTKILYAGLQSAYDALESKDPNKLYFCTDTAKLYKGEVDFTNSVLTAASKPEKPVAGKVYILADTNTVEAYVGGQWKVLSYPVATDITAGSDDVHVASAKAVYDAIQKAVEDLSSSKDTVKGVEAGSTDASIKVTKGDNSTSEFTPNGVVTTPVWDADARKLTLPVTGSAESVVVNIGKDIFIDPTAENKYNPETNTIDLYLNDGSGEQKAPTKISIPAAGLVDIYTGENTQSAKVTVSDDKKISVNVVVDPVAGNALVLTESGLKVDLSAYAKTEDVNAQVETVQKVAEAADTLSKANKAAIETLNGDVSVVGSVDKKINDAITPIKTSASDLEKRVAANETNITANTNNIAALAAATTEWGAF